MLGRIAVVLLVVGLGRTAMADAPHGPGLSPLESPRFAPDEVCNQMLEASRAGRLDDLIARTSVYARQKISTWDRLLIKLAHSRLAEMRCVRTTMQNGDFAMVQVYAPRGHSAPMPFIREEGVWRFDQRRWEELRHEGSAPKP